MRETTIENEHNPTINKLLFLFGCEHSHMAKLQSEATKAVASCAGSGWSNPNFGILTLLGE